MADGTPLRIGRIREVRNRRRKILDSDRSPWDSATPRRPSMRSGWLGQVSTTTDVACATRVHLQIQDVHHRVSFGNEKTRRTFDKA